MRQVPEPRIEHFNPYPNNYSQKLVVGPKFLGSIFRSNPSGDEEGRRQRFSTELLRWMKNEEIPYKRLIVNRHVLDEAATRLKKKARPRDAFRCVKTVLESKVIVVQKMDDDAFDEACTGFREFSDHEGAMTDFVTKTFTQNSDTSYLATWDSHYQAFEDITLLPLCDYS